MPTKTSSGREASDERGIQIRGSSALGEVVHARRKEQGVTLAEAAGLSGVGVRFLLELEHGKPTASLGKALQVLDRMGLELWIAPRKVGSTRKPT
jgi:HTH-type transcriptional regulator / antitoxin HipB